MTYTYDICLNYFTDLIQTAESRDNKLLERFDMWYLFVKDWYEFEFVMAGLIDGLSDSAIDDIVDHIRFCGKNIPWDKPRIVYEQPIFAIPKKSKIDARRDYLIKRIMNRKTLKKYRQSKIIHTLTIDDSFVLSGAAMLLSYNKYDDDQFNELFIGFAINKHEYETVRRYSDPKLCSALMRLIRSKYVYNETAMQVIYAILKLGIADAFKNVDLCYIDIIIKILININKPTKEGRLTSGRKAELFMKKIFRDNESMTDRKIIFAIRYIERLLSCNYPHERYSIIDTSEGHQLVMGLENGLSDKDRNSYRRIKGCVRMYFARMLIEHGKRLQDYRELFISKSKILIDNYVCTILSAMFEKGFTAEIMISYLYALSDMYNEIHHYFPNLRHRDIVLIATDEFSEGLNSRFRDFYSKSDSNIRDNFIAAREMFLGIESGLTLEQVLEYADHYKSGAYTLDMVRFIRNSMLSKYPIKYYEGPPSPLFIY